LPFSAPSFDENQDHFRSNSCLCSSVILAGWTTGFSAATLPHLLIAVPFAASALSSRLRPGRSPVPLLPHRSRQCGLQTRQCPSRCCLIMQSWRPRRRHSLRPRGRGAAGGPSAGAAEPGLRNPWHPQCLVFARVACRSCTAHGSAIFRQGMVPASAARSCGAGSSGGGTA
jgi:hypothetical protein